VLPGRETGILHVGVIIGNDLKPERTFLKRRPDFEGFFFGVGSLREICIRGDLGEGMDFGEESVVTGDGVLTDLKGDGGAIFFPPLLGKMAA